MRVVSCLLIVLCLCGCGAFRSTPDTSLPAMPGEWLGAHAMANASLGGRWWENFGDPVLTELIDRALEVNSDLAAAALRIRSARLQAGLAESDLWPSVDVSGNMQVRRDLRSNTISRDYSVSGGLNYELDLWGRLAAARDAARWEAEATVWDRESAALTLIGDVAENYWRIAYLHQRIAVAKANIASSEDTLALVRIKFEAGAISGVDLVQARQDLATQRATLAPLEEELTQRRLALSLLFDQAPQIRMPESEELTDLNLEIGAGIPADLLARRPDLRAAQTRLWSTLADADSTRLSFFPTFSLTGSLGGSSSTLENVLRNPVAALGAGIVLPFVQWNSMQLKIKVAETEYETAVVEFRKTLYTALSEVENALAARTRTLDEAGFLEESLALARENEMLVGIQYREGATSMLEVLSAADKRRSAELSLAANRLDRLLSMLQLYQTLGGDTLPAAG